MDPVCGWGMLNVEAVDRNNPNWTAAALKSASLAPGPLDTWNQEGAFLVAYETVGNTYRDFIIPLSSQLVTSSQIVNGTKNRFQAYIYERMLTWAGGFPHRHHGHKK